MRTKRDRQAAGVVKSLVLAGMGLAAIGDLSAQTKSATVPDAQVESNVLKALAGNTKLADQQISSSAVYGVVTLSGHVTDDATRTLADDLVSRTAGVQKVVDEMTIGAPEPAASASEANSDQGSNPQLQSDGTMAPAPDGSQSNPAAGPPAQGSAQNSAQAAAGTPGDPIYGNAPYGGQDQTRESQNQTPYGAQNDPTYPQQGQPGSSQQAPPYSQQGQYGQAGPPPYGQAGQPPYDQAGQPPYNQGNPGPYGQQAPPYGPQSQSPYGQAGPPPSGAPGQYPGGSPAQRGYTASGQGYGQPGGQPVNVPAGVTLQVRMNQGLDSRHSQVGTPFSGTVIRDVVANGFVAIPRGATVQGNVVEVSNAGVFKGRASLELQLTQLTLGGRTYPLTSNIWGEDGSDKTVRTVNSALGLGVIGAIIGGVAGGGAGAAIGAGAGGAAGLGASAASGGGQAFLPPEAVINFQLTQPTPLTTVSQAEMDRLGYGIPVGPQVRRRYPPPPPYYYGRGYYAYPGAYYRPY